MNISDIQVMYDYNQWANRIILGKAAQVTSEQFNQPTNFPWKNLRGTLLHTMNAENIWRLICQTGQRPNQRLGETQPFETLDSIRLVWQEEANAMQNYLASLNNTPMDTLIRYTRPDGVYERVLWHCLYHMINHGMQHRSECAAMLTDFGYSPGDIDFTHFLNQRAGIE